MSVVPQDLPAFRLRRAELDHQRRERETREREAKAASLRAEQHARSAQQADEARQALASPHATLRLALDWFRTEWQAALPSKMHETDAVEPQSDWGAPAWTDHFRGWIDGPTDHLRRALAGMVNGNLSERMGAVYLFRLACLDFDILLAASRMEPPLADAYAAWYTEKAIGRLRERVRTVKEAPARPIDRPEWMDRLGIGQSESQARAVEGR